MKIPAARRRSRSANSLFARSLSWGMFASNLTQGLFCPISPSALKNQLTAIPFPPVAQEKREHSGDGRELSED